MKQAAKEAFCEQRTSSLRHVHQLLKVSKTIKIALYRKPYFARIEPKKNLSSCLFC